MPSRPLAGAHGLCMALLLAGGAAGGARAQPGPNSPFADPYFWEEELQPMRPLPEGIIGNVHPRQDREPLRRVNTLREVFQTLEACWRPPSENDFSGQEITLRVSFKRNGEVLGTPRITYYKPGAEAEQREPFTRSVREAFGRCAPLPFTESFGKAIAGRIFAIRFVDTRPM
ncbi:hypothetical protein [Microvirga subterranea]|uniref:TonB-like protein n=1 Tax=Microvirga subterranea TaxID=186651 RepID=A0A370HNB3_9HYPH|nr:hypothetical protein [Microvirga subterranea]RDI60052.1 hypothetical protein DES45_103312 [Microvirga subterranea]